MMRQIHRGVGANNLLVVCNSISAKVYFVGRSKGHNFYLSWLSYSYKPAKMLYVCVDANHGGTNRNRCTQRFVILHTERDLYYNDTLIARQN